MRRSRRFKRSKRALKRSKRVFFVKKPKMWLFHKKGS